MTGRSSPHLSRDRRCASSSTGSSSPTGIANGELRGVHADGDAARAGIAVVARQRALARSSSLRAAVERQWVRRDDPPAQEGAPKGTV